MIRNIEKIKFTVLSLVCLLLLTAGVSAQFTAIEDTKPLDPMLKIKPPFPQANIPTPPENGFFDPERRKDLPVPMMTQMERGLPQIMKPDSNLDVFTKSGSIESNFAFSSQTAAVTGSYTMIDLGTAGDCVYYYPQKVNEVGDVIGHCYDANYNYYKGFVYHNGQITILSLGGTHSEARAINENGDVIGYSYTAGNQYQHAFVYRNGQMIDLNLGGTYSYAQAINENGDVIGYSNTTGNQGSHAFVYRNGQMINLGTLGGNYSYAQAINENGDVIGYSYTAGNQYHHAFVYRNGQMIDLGTLGGNYSYAQAINENGDVVGHSNTAGNQYLRGFIVYANANTAPTAVADSYSTDEDTALSNNVLTNDSDNENDSLTAVLVSAPANAASFTLNADGSFSYMPNADYNGSDSFTYKANDGQADSNTVTVSITVNPVNDAPVLSNVPANAVIDEEVLYSFTATAMDVDSANLQFSLINAPAGASIDANTGAFAWTPTEAQGPGIYNFTVRVSDGSLDVDATIQVQVNEVNIAPTLLDVPASATIDELVQYTFTATATDPDMPVNTLTFSLVGAPSGAAINPSTGAFSWTPTEAQGNGSTYNFTVRVSDGTANTDQAIALRVNEINSAPTLAAIADQTVDEETLLSVTASGSDTDDPANGLTYSLDAGAPDGMTIDPNTGAISWTPTEAQGAGDYPVTVRVTDDGTGNLSDTKTFNVHVNEVNIAPELGSIGNKIVDEMTLLTFTAMATDVDLPANGLSYSLVNAPAGASIDSSTGVFTWTPSEAQGGNPNSTYTFKVKVTDDGTPALSDDEEITVTVNEVNVAPVLSAISNQTGYWGNAFSFDADATDADIPTNTLSFSLIGAPMGASINSSTGEFTWTPTSAQIGSHTFTVRVTDNGTPNLYDEKSVTINVGKRPTALIYTGDGSEQYSDQQALSATLTDNGGGAMQGLPLSGKTVGFVIGSQNASGSTNASGVASANLILTQDPAPVYTVDSSFAGDSLYLSSSDSDPFDITQEDARAYYTGALFANANTSGGATVTLSATIRDITAESSDPATDVFGGDITNAKVDFINHDNGNVLCSNLPVGLVSSGDSKVGTATCNWNTNIGNEDAVIYTIGIVVKNYYTRNNSNDNEVVTVAKATPGLITGGGYLLMSNPTLSSGLYPGAAGTKTNFGFNIKNETKKMAPKGNINVIIRNGGRVYQIKGNAMTSLGTQPNSVGGKATFNGKANIQDITNPLNVIPIDGNATLQVTLTDNGSSGDLIGITVWNKQGGLWYASRWDGTKTVEQILGGGNLVVR